MNSYLSEHSINQAENNIDKKNLEEPTGNHEDNLGNNHENTLKETTVAEPIKAEPYYHGGLLRYKKLFNDFPQEIPDNDVEKLGIIWDKIETFIVEDLKDGFQMRDLYSLIIAVMNGLELFFPGVSGDQLKKYAIYIVKRLIAELNARNVIPPEVAIMLNFIPIGTIIDLVSNLVKKPPLVNKISYSEREEFDHEDFVKRNWM